MRCKLAVRWLSDGCQMAVVLGRGKTAISYKHYINYELKWDLRILTPFFFVDLFIYFCVVSIWSHTPVGGKPLGGFNRFAHSAGPGVEGSQSWVSGWRLESLVGVWGKPEVEGSRSLGHGEPEKDRARETERHQARSRRGAGAEQARSRRGAGVEQAWSRRGAGAKQAWSMCGTNVCCFSCFLLCEISSWLRAMLV